MAPHVIITARYNSSTYTQYGVLHIVLIQSKVWIFSYFCAIIKFSKATKFLGRIVAIDYGNKRVGIAVTDPLKLIASPLDTIHAQDILSFLKNYILKESVEAFVVGMPKTLGNNPTDVTSAVVGFVRKLKKEIPEIPVHTIDERFTSRMAFQAMIDGGVKKKDRQNKATVDKVSAAIILQSYLAQNNL